MQWLSRRFPLVLGLVFVVFWAYWAVEPFSRRVWWAENLPVIGVFLILACTYTRFRFSNLAYALMAVWLFWHTVGGHYMFAHVPFGFVTDLFGFERNHFDRIGHFSVGFYAFAAAELLLRRRWTGPVVAGLFGLFLIMSVAAGYEILEWWFAVLEGGDVGHEFLGSQGDVWDAQKDMLLDTCGALASLALFYGLGRHRVA
ncbi:putative membrane protein [Desulfobaculum xiamenense]|uniref:Putative membrane protein n=1 Tax=Desulfobaculum xiamenense TaxID=995050 RepID=A0A846QLN1_9BACT|nr:DUF2238 domain-containing protein [Desulfobaculum xiamenense]NJB69011.1 putative membrane protein [Desulfobaculum xiamenense]